MSRKKWYNWRMSKINQKPNWQIKNSNDDFELPKQDKESVLENKTTNNAEQSNTNLDVNLIIAGFQEKLSQAMTELIVKDATIKQLLLQIEKIKG